MRQTFTRCILALLFLLALGCSKQDGMSGSASPTTALFDPTDSTGSSIPLPNVLATASAKDPLTQYTSASGAIGVRPANTPMTPPEALAYVNLYEMGNTNAVSGVNAPIYIRFSAPLDPTTVTAANIKVFQTTGDSNGLTENNPLTFKDVSGLFDYRYTAGGTDLFLFPKFPLLPGTRYLYLVTNRVKDTNQSPVTSSLYFDALKLTQPLTGSSFAGLEPVRANTTSNGAILFSGYAKVMDDLIAAAATTTVTGRDQISLLGRFITTGAGAVRLTVTGASTDFATANLVPMESALYAFAAKGLPGNSLFPASSGYTPWTVPAGSITNITPDTYWSAVLKTTTTAPASVGAVYTGTIASADLSMDPVVVAANTSSMDLTGVTGADNPAAGVLQPFRTGSSKQLSGFYYANRTVPFVYITPKGTAPAGGWPLVIFQHGITGQKEQVIAVAQTLTQSGFAVAAIDLPLHGQLAISGHTTGAVWGQDFMALGAPLATRSNIQQAAFNLDRLQLTVKAGGFAGLGADAPSMATTPKFVGISLGSIVGAYYLAGNTTLSTTGYPYTQTSLNSDMKGLLSVPGGRLAYLLQDSPAFSPSINAGLAAVGIKQGTPTYNQFFQVTQSVVDPVDPATITTPLASGLPSRLSGRVLIQEATSTTSTNGDQVITNPYCRYFGSALGGRGVIGAEIASGFNQLAYLTNSRIPSLFLYYLSATGAPLPKTVVAAGISQSAPYGPLAATPTEGYFQFDQSDATHGMLLDPVNSPKAIVLAQTQMAYYLLTGVVVDPTTSPLAPVYAAKLGATPSLPITFSLPQHLTILGY